MRHLTGGFFISLICIAMTSTDASAQSEAWVLDTPDGFQRMGGAATLGPYSSRAACESVRSSDGGFQNNPQARCRQISSGSSSGGYTSSPVPSNWGDVASYGIQTAVSSFIDGWRRGREMARQRAMMEERQRQMDIIAAREREAREAAAREEERRQREAAFQRGKASLRELMQLPPPDGSLGGIRREGGSAAGSLDGLRRGDVNTSPPAELRIAPSGETSQPTGNGKLYCSISISILAAEATLAGKTDEGMYLSRQSQNAFKGAGLEVQCPELGRSVPEIGAIKCTVRRDGKDVPVPCDDEPLRRFYPDLLESTQQEIDRLTALRQRFPDLGRAKTEAAENLREKNAALERARTEEAAKKTPVPSPAPTPAPRPRTQPCSTDLCKQAQREKEEAEKIVGEVGDAYRDEADARSALQRNVVILKEGKSNPAGVSSMLSRIREPKGRRP